MTAPCAPSRSQGPALKVVIRRRRRGGHTGLQLRDAPFDCPETFPLTFVPGEQAGVRGQAKGGSGGEGLGLLRQLAVQLGQAPGQNRELRFDRSSGRWVHLHLQPQAIWRVQRRMIRSKFGSGSGRPRQAGASLRQSQTPTPLRPRFAPSHPTMTPPTHFRVTL